MILYNFLPRLRARLADDNAQVLPMMAVLMVGFLGMAALVADVGDVYYSYNELVASTNSAVLAAAVGLETSTTQAQSYADAYGSSKGEANQFGNLNVSASAPTVTPGCASNYTSLVPCKFGTGNDSNAVQVSQTAQVKTYFAALFGTPYVNLTATASALVGSPDATPRNIAIILDTTQSMSTTDSSCKNVSRETCAQEGVQQLLTGLQPCEDVGCGALSGGNYATAADRVALFTFPELTSSTQQQYDTDCNSSKSPSITPYTFPSSTGQTYNPGTGGDYEVTPFQSNYQTAASMGTSSVALAGTGSNASSVVEAVGGGGCAAGMGDPGGEGTYYAGVLYAAQAALLAEQAALLAQNPSVTSTNVIIILSDGAATASSSQMAGGNATGKYTTGSNPTGSYYNECEQAITAANSVKTAGTAIYSIAYGSQTTGCTTDNTKVSGGQSSPCSTMQLMAGNSTTAGGSGSSFFFSGDQGGSDACPATGKNASITSLDGIFSAITTNFGPARLIPNTSF